MIKPILVGVNGAKSIKKILKQEILLLMFSLLGFVSFYLLYDINVGLKFSLYSFLGCQIIILSLMLSNLILFAIDARKKRKEKLE
jgi:hypothetical protein